MKLTDKEGLEIASTVKDVLEGKVKKETYGKKKKVDEVEEPRPEDAGASAVVDMYKLSSISICLMHSLIIGFLISLKSFTCSVSE